MSRLVSVIADDEVRVLHAVKRAVFDRDASDISNMSNNRQTIRAQKSLVGFLRSGILTKAQRARIKVDKYMIVQRRDNMLNEGSCCRCSSCGPLRE